MIKTNKDKLVVQEVLGKISHPVMIQSRGYVITWDGKPKIGLGIGGIKYNVKVGDPIFGWPEAEYLEPGVALEGIDDRAKGALLNLSCVGNEVKVISGEGKGLKGVVTGKAGYAGAPAHVLAHFSDEDLEKLAIGDKVRIKAEGVGLEIKGFEGKVFNVSPSFLESLDLELEDGELIVPVVKEIPAYAMGSGVGGGAAMSGHWCIQTCPPELVKELGLEDLRIGDLVACRDILMLYGKGYYKGAITVGIIAFGASDRGGHGAGVFAIAVSKEGKIRPRIDPEANVAKYLGLKR
ncbi:DUF4438 domain-containing protein [Candidatus Bathyarchaeota archaeon]|nr:MAG: DUF4438 domain-containing protein [Candidatus Bathyarchaeota archaeon]